MNIMRKTVESQPLDVCVPTGASLTGFTELELHYIDPEGTQSYVEGSVYSSTYVQGTIPKDSLIPGLWAFWAEGVEPGGRERVTIAVMALILKKGQAS